MFCPKKYFKIKGRPLKMGHKKKTRENDQERGMSKFNSFFKKYIFEKAN